MYLKLTVEFVDEHGVSLAGRAVHRNVGGDVEENAARLADQIARAVARRALAMRCDVCEGRREVEGRPCCGCNGTGVRQVLPASLRGAAERAMPPGCCGEEAKDVEVRERD